MDTICAVATGHGQSAIAIIRMSGDKAISIANKVFRGRNLPNVKSHTICYGHIIDGEDVVDEVMVSIMLSPKTFTKEDTVEINCHGGVYVTQRILSVLLKNGAVLATPGEFTKRAFLAGRIDLTQAEAVMDIIAAEGKKSLSLANNGLAGVLSKKIKTIREELIKVLASIEVNIDYPEYDAAVMTNDLISEPIQKVMVQLKDMLAESHVGKMIKDGIKIAIIGRPNVGKSSLLNMILDEQKAIVTDIAGTTRDAVEGEIVISGMVVKLIDTAGIRDTADVVEKIGVEKAKKVMEEADLIILVLDGSQEITESDQHLLDLTADKKRIIVLNKSDLEKKLNLQEKEVIQISCLEADGLEELESKILGILDLTEWNGNLSMLANTRHIAKAEEALELLNDAFAAITNNMPIDIVEIDIKSAWDSLGEIIGETATDTLLNELFSKFCLGK